MPPRSASLTLRRPPSHWAVPLLMAFAVWVPYVGLLYLPELVSTGPAAPYIQNSVRWVLGKVTHLEIIAVCGALSALNLLLFFFGLTRVRLSESGIQWEILPWIWRRWRWTSLREIRIDETGRHFEDDEFSKRTIIIRGPGPLGLGKDSLRLTNRVWDRFDEAETATVAVGVPAIATRLRQRLRKTRKLLRFALDGSPSLLLVLIYFVLGGGAVYAALDDTLWTGGLEPWRPVPMALAVSLFLMGIIGFLSQSVGVDLNYLYILRRGWVLRRIPLRDVADVETRDNATRIRVWKDAQRAKSREIWRTDRYISNRGVLLQLLRDLVTEEGEGDAVFVPASTQTFRPAARVPDPVPTPASPVQASPAPAPPAPAAPPRANRVLSAAPPPPATQPPSPPPPAPPPIPETRASFPTFPASPESPRPADEPPAKA